MYNKEVKRSTIHLSEAEAAAANLTALLARVRSGTEIVFEHEKKPIAVLRAVEPAPRSILECIALLSGDSTATVDSEFPSNVRAAAESQRDPLNPPAWD